VSTLHPPSAADTGHPHAAFGGELEGVRQQFFSTCCSRFESVTMLRPRFSSTLM